MPSRQSLKFFVCTRHLANQAKAMFVFTIMASSSSILSFPANHQQVYGVRGVGQAAAAEINF